MKLCHYRISGFTLVEMMVVIAISGILLVVGAPKFNSFLQSVRAERAVSVIKSHLDFARNQAQSYNKRVWVCPDGGSVPNGCGNDWKNGMRISILDSEGKIKLLKVSNAFNKNDLVTFPANILTFSKDGMIVGEMNDLQLNYCPDSAQNENSVGLVLLLSGSSRITHVDVSCS
ncbi:MAG: prepilin-type N-terminal cleavage/methylation domain-containing protein [Endozoicomonadaceae bacterium]|nr:prepilin-type N-terminal cleavage/methylation domain-containing protein [Endozoicomonadaceae bacterium]